MDVIVIQNYLLATMATLLLFHLFFLLTKQYCLVTNLCNVQCA